MCRSAGTTLLELLTTLTIVAVLATVAAPGFHTLQLDSRRTAVVNGFLHALFLARSEAIKRGQIVSVCRSSDGSNCEPSTRQTGSVGWIVFVNRDRDDPPERDCGEELITSSGGWPGGSITSNRRAYSFRPRRRGSSTARSCFATRAARRTRGPSSSVTRPAASRTARPSGKPLRCPSG